MACLCRVPVAVCCARNNECLYETNGVEKTLSNDAEPFLGLKVIYESKRQTKS